LTLVTHPNPTPLELLGLPDRPIRPVSQCKLAVK
jgi:hypothetical protein